MINKRRVFRIPMQVHIHIFIIHHEIEGFENRCRDSEVWSGCNIVCPSNSASPFYVIFSLILVAVKIDPVIIMNGDFGVDVTS